jgi:pyruvate dehydrogenase (quinone)
VGDGAMQMSGMAELITVSRYWQRWPDPRFVVIVTNNRDLNMVTWEQRILEGDRKFDPSQTLPDVPYADYARMLGLGGMRIDRPEAIEDGSLLRSPPTGRSCSTSCAIRRFHCCRRTSRSSRRGTT